MHQLPLGKVMWNVVSKVALAAPFIGGHLLDHRGDLVLSEQMPGMDACAAAEAESKEREKPSEPQ
jgi:hypothetical protein